MSTTAPASLRRLIESRAARRKGHIGLVATLAVLTAVAVNLPLAYLFLRVAEGGWSAYQASVFSASTLRLTLRTLGLVGGVLVVAVPLGVGLAWLVTRTDLPGRRFWATTGALPLVFPSYVAALTFVAAFGPSGALQRALEPFGVTALPEIAYGYSGAVLLLALYTYPYLYLLAVATLQRLDGGIEEASRSLGAGRWRTFFSVELPLLLPAVSAGSLLIVLYVLSDFGAVSIVRFNTFTLAIYNAYRALFDRSVAASLATILVLLTGSFIVLEAWWSRRLRPPRKGGGRPAQPVPLGRWRWPVSLCVATLSIMNLWVPAGILVFWAVRALIFGNQLGRAGWPVLNSLGVALPTAILAVVLSLSIAVWAVRVGSVAARVVQVLTFAGHALPGLVVGLALVFFTLRVLPVLYQTVAVLLVAYLVRFLPEAISASRSALAVLSPEFEEAAKTLGGRPWTVFRTVTIPLIRPGLLAGGGLVFLRTMKELPATLILRPTGFETLATEIWSSAAEGIYSQAALPSLMLLLVTAVPVYLLIIKPGLEKVHGRTAMARRVGE
jgi:iron(III) transport system permease protein